MAQSEFIITVSTRLGMRTRASLLVRRTLIPWMPFIAGEFIDYCAARSFWLIVEMA